MSVTLLSLQRYHDRGSLQKVFNGGLQFQSKLMAIMAGSMAAGMAGIVLEKSLRALGYFLDHDDIIANSMTLLSTVAGRDEASRTPGWVSCSGGAGSQSYSPVN